MPTTQQTRAQIAKIKAKRPQQATIAICLEPELEVQLGSAKSKTPVDAGLVAMLEGAVEEATIELTLTAVGRLRYDELVLEHPATDEQKAEAKAEGNVAPYNADTFSVALISASLAATDHNPYQEEEAWRELTAEWVPQVQEWLDTWNINEFLLPWTTAVNVNSASQVRLVGKAYG